MADTQSQDSGSSTDIGSLIGSDKTAIADLLKVQEQKTATDTAIMSQSEKRMEADQARAEKAFAAEGVSAAEKLQPWDAEKEHKRFEHDPIEGFGSVGGLFAMIASAFTRAPMENAINGMAGAINSLKAGDEAAYERAHQSWQENTKLALERFKTQHELYQDALGLMDHDQVAANAKLHNAAVRFGDQQTLMLLDHGMSKELFELQAARAKSASDMQDMIDRTNEKTLRDRAYQAGLADLPQTGNPAVDAAHKLALFTRTHALTKETPQQALMGQFFLEKPQATAEEAATFADKHGIIRQYGLSGGAASLTNDRVINRDADLHKQRQREEHPDWNEDQLNDDRDAYVRSRKEATTPTSANRTDDLRSKIDQTDNIITGSQKNLDFLHNFKGGAGIMGKIMRGEEIASNIAGAGTQSERVEFRRRVHELQEMVPRIITDSNGRPLKAAQDKVDDFVAGLNAGDTGPNTIRAYEELIAEMKKRQQDYRGRLEHGYQPGTSSSGATTGDTNKAQDTDWLKTYPEKHSEIQRNQKVAGDPSDPNFWLEASS